jgi:hypothetical protein
MLLLCCWIIDFLFIRICLSDTQYLISFILFHNRRYLPLVHMEISNNLLLQHVNHQFGYLLVRRLIGILLVFLSQFDDIHLFNVIVIIIRVSRGICFFLLCVSFDELYTSVNNIIDVSVLIVLCGLMTNFLYSLDKSVMVSIGIIFYYPYSLVNGNDLPPMWHFFRTILFNSLELERESSSHLQFVRPVIIKISNFLYLQFLEVLNKIEGILHR